MWAWCHQLTTEGVLLPSAGPAKPQWLPAFVPVSMTTWILFCSLGLDIQREASEGCRGLRHTADALLPAGCSTLPHYTHESLSQGDQTPLPRPPSCLICLFSCILPPLLNLHPYPAVTYMYVSFLYVWLDRFCPHPAAGHELIMKTQGFSVSITKLWHHHKTRRHASKKQTSTRQAQEPFLGSRPWETNLVNK